MKLETAQDLLERVRAEHKWTWYRLAKELPAHENTVSNWRHGRTTVDRKFAPRIAELLDESAEYVLACLEAEREQSAEVLKVWERIAAKFHTASILLTSVMLVGGAGAPTPSEAHEHSADAGFVDLDIHYAHYVRHSSRSSRLLQCLKTMVRLPLRFATWTRARISSMACPSRCFAH